MAAAPAAWAGSGPASIGGSATCCCQLQAGAPCLPAPLLGCSPEGHGGAAKPSRQLLCCGHCSVCWLAGDRLAAHTMLCWQAACSFFLSVPEELVSQVCVFWPSDPPLRSSTVAFEADLPLTPLILPGVSFPSGWLPPVFPFRCVSGVMCH